MTFQPADPRINRLGRPRGARSRKIIERDLREAQMRSLAMVITDYGINAEIRARAASVLMMMIEADHDA
jgi:hypothetical protein